MTKTPVTTDVHETFDVQLNLRAELTFRLVLICENAGNGLDILVGPLLCFGVLANASLFKDSFRRRRTNSVDIGEADYSSFVAGQIHTCNTCHILMLIEYC